MIDPTLSHVSPTGNHYWYRKRREVAQLLAQHVTLPTGAQIVGFGAGQGKDIPLLESLYPNAAILAFDGSKECADTIGERFRNMPNIRAEQADLRQRLPLEDETVDLGYCSEVLEHMPDPGVVLAEFHRVIKPHRHLLVTTPNQPNVFQRSFWRRRRPGDGSADSDGCLDTDQDLYGHISLTKVNQWDAALLAAWLRARRLPSWRRCLRCATMAGP